MTIGILTKTGELFPDYHVEKGKTSDPNRRYEAWSSKTLLTFHRRRSDAWFELTRHYCLDRNETTSMLDLAIRRLTADPAVAERLREAFYDSWTQEEMSQVAVGLCWEQTAYGMPWTEYCENKAVGEGTLYCSRHLEEHRLEGIGSGAAGMRNWLPYFK